MMHTFKFKESRENDTQRRYDCVNCNLGVWLVAPRIFPDYDRLLTECMEKDDCTGQPQISIKDIAQNLYDLLIEREWDTDDWNQRNSCLSCGANAKAGMYNSLPNHKDGCEFVKIKQAFEKWSEESERHGN